eukprot:2087775-Pleurochrysis_carterae.AAC.1
MPQFRQVREGRAVEGSRRYLIGLLSRRRLLRCALLGQDLGLGRLLHQRSLPGEACALLCTTLTVDSSAPLRKPFYYALRQQPKIGRRNCATLIFKFVTISIIPTGLDLNHDPSRHQPSRQEIAETTASKTRNGRG